MKLINLTPHAVTIVNGDGAIIATYPSEGEARIAQTNTPCGDLDRVPVCKVAYGEAIGLPEPQPDTGYIVSYITIAQIRLSGARTVDDLYYPTEMARDEKGRIIGSRYLAWGGGATTKADRIRKLIMDTPYGIPKMAARIFDIYTAYEINACGLFDDLDSAIMSLCNAISLIGKEGR